MRCSSAGREGIVLSLESFAFFVRCLPWSEMMRKCDDMSQLQENDSLRDTLGYRIAWYSYLWEHMILMSCEWFARQLVLESEGRV